MATVTEQYRLTKFLDGIIQDDPEAYLKNILQFGCASGCVSEMIYYTDTHKFFDEHYHEIEEIREDWEFQTGAPLDIKGDLKIIWRGLPLNMSFIK